MKSTWFLVAALMAGLYAVDKSLAALETREVNAEAANHYSDGQKLLAAGKAGDAVDAFRRAHTLDRTNRDFELALANAELSAGRTEDAQQMVNEVLTRNSNDGRANLLMARVRLAQGGFDDAVSFYHRAIYGSGTDRVQARLELAGKLAERGRSEELLSELLLLDGAAPGNEAFAKRVAALYLEAGSAKRAETAYRAILRATPGDADALEGLGEAELRQGQYRSAHAAFSAAVKEHPEDEAKVRLADRLVELDPTSRRLSAAEKYRRSHDILQLVVESVGACSTGRNLPAELQDQLTSSTKMLAEKVGPAPSNEAAERRLELAEEIWKARPKSCATQSKGDELLPILIGKMEQ